MTTNNSANITNVTSGAAVPSLFQTSTTTASANFDIITLIPSTYSACYIEFSGILPQASNTNDHLRLRCFESDGTTVYTSGQYNWDFRYFNDDGTANFSDSNGQTYVDITPQQGMDYNAASTGEGQIVIFNPTGQNNGAGLISVQHRWRGNGSTASRAIYGCCICGGGPVYGIRLLWSSGGNFQTGGVAKIYGFPN